MKSIRGFTLIEIMIVVAIVAILAAIAVPAFTEQMAKSRRSDAIRGLGEMQLAQERWRSNNSTYAATASLALPASDYYDFAVTANTATATGYTMTAAPKASGAQAGDRCGTYTLQNNAGTISKTVSTTATGCWGN